MDRPHDPRGGLDQTPTVLSAPPLDDPGRRRRQRLGLDRFAVDPV
jgi:hypothetical protein